MIKAVLDTNVLVAGLKSSLGASFQVINLAVQRQRQPAVTTPLVMEYESVLARPGLLPSALTRRDVGRFLDWFVFISTQHRVHYLWRPMLPDPKDDLVLEAALAADSRYIVTLISKTFGALPT